MLNFSHSSTNHKFNDYLCSCDLINKYNLKNIHDRPQLDQIVVNVKLKDFLLAAEISETEQTHAISQIKSYLVVYTLLGFIPYLNCNKNALVKFSKNLDVNYSLKLVFSSFAEKCVFLTSIFVDNWNMLKLDNISVLNKSQSKKSSLAQKFLVTTTLPGNAFSEVDELFKKQSTLFNVKLLKFHINFLILNPKLKNNHNLIKNLQFFWING